MLQISWSEKIRIIDNWEKWLQEPIKIYVYNLTHWKRKHGRIFQIDIKNLNAKMKENNYFMQHKGAELDSYGENKMSSV